MKNYIFLTAEGFTFQPNSDSIEPDINNLQVIGFSAFDEIFAYELAKTFKEKKALHYLSRFKQS